MTTETERKPLEKLNLKIGGMQCSFCVDSVHKALARVKGVGGVAVSLSHEEALVRYDPEEAAPAEIENTLTSMGYTVRDPRKVFSFEEEEAEVRRGILNQHVLMEFGAFAGLAGGAVGFFKSPWPTGDFLGAAVFITAYHVFSMYVSTAVRTKSSRAIRKLMDLRPATARVLRDGREEETPVEE
ncbi:MAG: cation transporter, partial [Nitrospinota bacterium]|nr:cation transporter [Nitrospinota bacterium]